MSSRNYRFLIFISGVFGALLIISNVLAAKIVAVGNFTFPAAAILFPLTYVLGDVLTEVYGYANARRVIWAGFAGAFLWAVTYWIAEALPPAPFWHHQAAFEQVLGLSPRLAFAGMFAYLVGEFVNSYVVARMKVYWNGKFLPARLIFSTIVGQALDTALIVSLGFGGVFAASDLISMAFSLWSLKVGWEVVALPVTLPFVRWLKRAENEDFFDRDTDFNPFMLDVERSRGK